MKVTRIVTAIVAVCHFALATPAQAQTAGRHADEAAGTRVYQPDLVHTLGSVEGYTPGD